MSHGSYKTVSDMVTEIGRIVEDVSPSRKVSIKEALIREYDALVEVYEWPQLTKVDSSGKRSGAPAHSGVATLESGDAYYPAPYGCGFLKSMQLLTIAMGPFSVVDPQEFFDQAGSAPSATGVPWMMTEIGRTAQWRSTGADATTLSVHCSVATNNGNSKAVRVWYRKADSYVADETYQDVTGNFSLGVVLASGAEFDAATYPIAAIHLPEGWVGNCQIVTAGNVVVAEIPPYVAPTSSSALVGDRLYARKLYQVFPVPATDFGCAITWWATAKRLTGDGDVPVIPVANYLVEAVSADILHQMGEVPKAILRERRADRFLKAALNQNKQSGPRGMRPKWKNLLRMMDIPLW